MVRNTSLIAYRRIESEGLLSKMRFAVYKVLFHHGPLTRAEIVEHLKKPGMKRQPDIYNRLSDLKRRGVADIVGTRDCTVTTHKCQVWDVTSKIPPKKVGKPPSRLEILEKENEELRRENLDLKVRLYGKKAKRRAV